jgi:hypothetical protein
MLVNIKTYELIWDSGKQSTIIKDDEISAKELKRGLATAFPDVKLYKKTWVISTIEEL